MCPPCCWTTHSLNVLLQNVVLFSVVAFKTLDISQGSVATHLRYGGIFSDNIITNFIPILTVRRTKMCQFLEHPVSAKK